MISSLSGSRVRTEHLFHLKKRATTALTVDLAVGVYLGLTLTGGFAVLRRDPGPRLPDAWAVVPSAQLVAGLGKRF